MTKTLTEQWREGTLENGFYYVMSGWSISVETRYLGNGFFEGNIKVLAPVPSYDKVKEMSQKIERLEFDNEALEMAHNEGKEINAELVSKTEQLVQKMHILEKQLAIATNALKETKEKLLHVELSGLDGDNRQKMYDLMFEDGVIDKALKEMEGVK